MPRQRGSFAAQLVAMNAGIKPVFRSEGGQTTNIGDINVSVTGGDSEPSDGSVDCDRVAKGATKGNLNHLVTTRRDNNERSSWSER